MFQNLRRQKSRKEVLVFTGNGTSPWPVTWLTEAHGLQSTREQVGKASERPEKTRQIGQSTVVSIHGHNAQGATLPII